MLVNTGSWYQILLRRKKEIQEIPYPPIINFRVTSDILDMHIGLSAQNLDTIKSFSFAVQNTDLGPGSLIFGVENLDRITNVKLWAQNLDKQPSIILGVNNID